MGVLAFAVLICGVCVGASAKRLWIVFHTTAFDLARLATLAKAGRAPDVLRSLASPGAGEFEHGLVQAVRSPAPAAALGEPLMELEYSLRVWARVPRVCASIGSTTGFLCASLRLRDGLLSDDLEASGALDVILSGVDMVALGFATALICVAVHRVAAKQSRAVMVAADALSDALVPVDDGPVNADCVVSASAEGSNPVVGPPLAVA